MSWAIWITGLPGSGKSALARAAARQLGELGEPTTILEMDAIRKILTPAPTYSASEREVVYRALVYLAWSLTEAGVPVIIDATAHRREWRDLARASIVNFAEVQLACPLEVCRAREAHRAEGHAPRGIYAAAGRPGATVPGVDVPYEPALNPDIVIDTSVGDPETPAATVVALALDLTGAAPRLPRLYPVAGWAMWLTGLPGSGKTTLASSAAETLAARGVPVELLGPSDVRRFIAGAGYGGPAEEEIVHRALVCAAKLLTDAGVPVIIDATAPRRRWRALARELIPHYAEIQLVCPAEICCDRERVTRWNLPSCSYGGRPRAFVADRPDVVPDYEPSLNPELTIHTDVRDPWSVTEEILGLAHRLHRAALASASRLKGGLHARS